ncbi:MAG: hypothetical protein AABM66_11840 [Actinomycetota bacterium]
MTEAQRKQKAQERVEALEKELDSQIGRWVAAGVAVLAPVIAVACAWLQDKIGVNLDPSEVTGFISATVVGITGAGATWVYNRGGFEKNAEELVSLYLRGKDIEA